MIKVTSEVRIYERDGKDYESGAPALAIVSHWSDRSRVTIVLPDGTKLTVIARDLEAAIKNATNTAKY